MEGRFLGIYVVVRVKIVGKVVVCMLLCESEGGCKIVCIVEGV